MRQSTRSALVQVMAYRLFGAKPLPEPKPAYCQLLLLGSNFSENRIGILSFSFKKMHLKLSSAKVAAILSRGRWVNTVIPEQNDHHFADMFKYIFMNEKKCISIEISRKFVSKGPIDNKSGLVQVMTWRRAGDKSLSESTLTQFTDAYIYIHIYIHFTSAFPPHNYSILIQNSLKFVPKVNMSRFTEVMAWRRI